MRLRPRLVVLIVAGVIAAFVIEEAVRTLWILDAVEQERDRWQRPERVVAALDLRPGQRVVDFGSGAGYFSLKMAPLVGSGGEVLAVDLRRQSLAFLWIRAQLRGDRNVHPIVGAETDPRLPARPVDGVLIANTYHELRAPDVILSKLFASMRPGGRLVVVDRGPRSAPGTGAGLSEHHEIDADAVSRTAEGLGFRLRLRDDLFIDQPGDDVWWLLAFDRP